ncbi:hypothetical protein DIZ81_12690 [Legionella taurinensis]|uniref:F-box domain-containing protein n=2 Tax=Legionella taurinensis TaxID=70611 RepID=A0A3A5L3K8_9GAMM|nr:hypothetical protein DB745_12495 [Legionella taurinensis]RJT46600.1 hypothetical protein D6J04_08635 [Legionella taurinensis]TID40227.1 hypothetical protein DIZ81_12690 [Legionella taurinensis]TID41116.1 hypothetical protein DIZ39_12495 [Legionella taurinensis]TID48208.1 hypothetical protein DIZ64_12780 [Legionella taurinensis]
MDGKTELTPSELEKYRKKIGDFFNLPSNEQLELVSDLSAINNLPKAIKDLTCYPYFQALPKDALNVIGSYLTEKDISAFITTHKQPHTFLQPARLVDRLLQHVVMGNQKKAEAIVAMHPELLLDPGKVTDYSLRTFKQITAYEYAYWAKDTHMRRMLEKYMDANTSAEMLKRCEDIDKNGVSYTQHGVKVKGSTGFNFTPLKAAMKEYMDIRRLKEDTEEQHQAWLKVGKVQYDVPVHVANEYCRDDLPFQSSTFVHQVLPRKLSLYKYGTGKNNPCFYSSDLGTKVAYLRAISHQVEALPHPHCDWVAIDLAAIGRLEKVRTAELAESLETLRTLSQKKPTNSG